MTNFPWTCPFCNRDTIITETNYQSNDVLYKKGSALSEEENILGLECVFVVCPNTKCRQLSLAVHLREKEFDYAKHGYTRKRDIDSWRLIPESAANPFPDYIPESILEDYKEACLIHDKSPKASATLSRRCLQGMIRDFWQISKSRLIDEIEELKGKVDSPIWDAIDGVREVGNIGAHMEKDVNLIIDVESNEADLLIKLIETLLKEWYVRRYEREENAKAVKELAAQKTAQKKANVPKNTPS